MKICTIVGARPQFIKASAVSHVIDATDEIEEILVHTGQHYDANMSDVFFEELKLRRPNYNLDIGGGPHGQMTGQQLIRIEEVLIDEQPDVVLVYGDTNSTLAGALAAAKLHVPVAHVEAGLRSFNRRMPEEINRILTDHVSEWLFAPTQFAMDMLENEGLGDRKLHLVGDVMYDVALEIAASRAQRNNPRAVLGLDDAPMVLATIHRQENTDDPARLEEIFGALIELTDRYTVVIPLHPRLKGARKDTIDALSGAARLHFTDPLGFGLLADLVADADLVVTDSGGLQKEAFFHRTKCVTVRDETEWQELVENGWNRLPTSIARPAILEAVELQMAANPAEGFEPYGDGASARKIVGLLTQAI